LVAMKWEEYEVKDGPTPICLTRKTDEYNITPELAAEWLERNTHNRPLNLALAGIYARDMLAGNWQVNGESIKLSQSGTLLDGQHRLHAVIIAGRAIRSVVTFGLSDDTFRTIDGGRRRSMADVLSISAERSSTALAAALHTVWRYEQGWLTSTATQNGRVPSHAELLDVYQRHPGIRASLAKGSAVTKILGGGLASGLHYLFSGKDATLADIFFDSLASGENLSAGEPVLTLRNRLVDNRANKAKVSRGFTVQMCLKAWNATRHGRSLRLIKLIDGDPETITIS